MAELRCEVCVVGGGPAGAIAAFRLATLGRDVCLVERQAFPRSHVGEAISPGIWPLLDSVGLAPMMARASFRPVGETLLCWAEAQPQRRPVGEKSLGRLVDRGEFDEMLLHAARLAGVRVIQPAKAAAVRSSGGWKITANPGGDSVEISARILLDAAGRKGCLPVRRVSVSPPTLAWWAHLDIPPNWKDSQTRVEAIPEGWVWAAPVGAEGRLSLLLFCDPERRVAQEQAEAVLRKRLAASTLFAGCARAALSGPVAALDATSSYAVDTVGADFVKIGEAAYSLDPLSSTGVEKAIQSALGGATVAHTLLDYPDRGDLCAQFYRERQQEAVAQHSIWAAGHYSEVNRFAERPFWRLRRGRSIEPATAPFAANVVDSSPPSLGTMVRVAPEIRFSREPCIVGSHIELRDALSWPAQTRPLIFLDGIEVATLLAGENRAATWQEFLSRWSQLIPPIRAKQLAVWLWRRGVIRTESEAVPAK